MLTQIRVNAAAAVLKTFTQTYGSSASDTMIANAIYSIASVLSGQGAPAAEYASAIKQATGNELKLTPGVVVNKDGSVEVAEGNILGIPAGSYYPQTDDDFEIDEEPVEAALPDEAALGRMKKADLIAQAEAEQLQGTFDEGMTNAELVAAILESRQDAAGEEGTNTGE